MKTIGLLDYEASLLRRYKAPNYDIGLTYAYLKQDPNISVRLIATLTESNLSTYDEIWVFKLTTYSPHPSTLIHNYYKYPIKEYGPGFQCKERRPFLKETMYIAPDFSCYNPMIKFSLLKSHNKQAWSIDPTIQKHKYTHVRLYEEIEGEWLRRDIKAPGRYSMIHDDPTVLFTNPVLLEGLCNFRQQKHTIAYAQKLDISQINDTTLIEQVMTDRVWASIRKELLITQMNANALWFIDYCATHQCNPTQVWVLFPKDKNDGYYCKTLLELAYNSFKTGGIVHFTPYNDLKPYLRKYSLARLAYQYIFNHAGLDMAFYEYVFFVGCRLEHWNIPSKPRTKEEVYEDLLMRYGMPRKLRELEDLLRQSPDLEELVFTRGSSRYEEIRKKAYNATQEYYAFSIGGTNERDNKND